MFGWVVDTLLWKGNIDVKWVNNIAKNLYENWYTRKTGKQRSNRTTNAYRA